MHFSPVAGKGRGGLPVGEEYVEECHFGRKKYLQVPRLHTTAWGERVVPAREGGLWTEKGYL